jgi:hypothetical protein
VTVLRYGAVVPRGDTFALEMPFDEDLQERVRQVWTLLEVALEAVGTFAGSGGVVFYTARVTRRLLQYHEDVLRICTPHVLGVCGSTTVRGASFRTAHLLKMSTRRMWVERSPWLTRSCPLTGGWPGSTSSPCVPVRPLAWSRSREPLDSDHPA